MDTTQISVHTPINSISTSPFSFNFAISFTNFVIYLAVWLLEGQAAAVSYCVYLLIGIVGLPVFSGYSGGLGKLVGPTGGYLIGFIFMAMICSLVTRRTNYQAAWSMAGMAAATAVAYGFGTAWFMIQAKTTLGYALATCVIPFIPGDLVKIVLSIDTLGAASAVVVFSGVRSSDHSTDVSVTAAPAST